MRTRRFTWTAPYLFIGASAVYLALFVGVPLVQGLWLSFTDTRVLNPTGGEFVGLENYTDLVADEAFANSVVTTLVYTFFTVLGAIALGTVSAIVLNQAFPGRALARAIIVMPWAVPGVALALAFRWIFNGSSGIANEALNALGIGSVGWLTDPDYGMASVLIATIWKVSPFVMLVMLAALQSVPEELYEATRVDGADAFTSFKTVALPFLMPTIRVVALLMTIWSFRRFEIIYVLTGGGPGDATNTLVINVYDEAFSNGRLGVAAAVGVMGLLLALVVTLVYFVLEKRTERQDRGAAAVRVRRKRVPA